MFILLQKLPCNVNLNCVDRNTVGSWGNSIVRRFSVFRLSLNCYWKIFTGQIWTETKQVDWDFWSDGKKTWEYIWKQHTTFSRKVDFFEGRGVGGESFRCAFSNEKPAFFRHERITDARLSVHRHSGWSEPNTPCS